MGRYYASMLPDKENNYQFFPDVNSMNCNDYWLGKDMITGAVVA